MCSKFLIFILISIFAPTLVQAKIFRNAYVQFELPEKWNCNLEGTEWVCSSQNKTDAREAIIILTAKEVGPQDSFQIYENHLKTPKKVLEATGKSTPSQVKNMRTRKINDHSWVDSLHLGSEIPGYYTRYVATIKDKLAVLVTLSAHQKYYSKYSNDFFKAVESLRVVATKDILTPKALAPIKPGSESYGTGIAPNIPPAEDAPSGSEDETQGPDPLMLSAIGLFLAALGYYIWKKRS